MLAMQNRTVIVGPLMSRGNMVTHTKRIGFEKAIPDQRTFILILTKSREGSCSSPLEQGSENVPYR